MCTVYSTDFVRHSPTPASNLLWGGVLFPCKRVAAFPFVGLRITHLNTWPFDRTMQGRVNQYARA